MRNFDELFQLLQDTVVKLVSLHSEGSIKIKKNFFNWLKLAKKRALYYIYDNEFINSDEFQLINDKLNDNGKLD